MKRLIAAILASALSSLTFAGETWKRDTYESGESVYHSNNLLGVVTAARLLVGERGVGFIYLSPNSAGFSHTFCFISIDDKPEEKCEIDFTNWPLIKFPRGLANRIADAKILKLRLRICEPAGYCSFAYDGGDTKQLVWEWDEPLSKNFPDFKPYPLK